MFELMHYLAFLPDVIACLFMLVYASCSYQKMRMFVGRYSSDHTSVINSVNP